MKITCKQQDLKQGLSIVSHAVASRSPLPILTNILLTTDKGRLKISATNLEISITCFVDAEIHEEGTITIPAKTFTELVNSLAQGQIDLNVPSDTNTVKIKSHGSNANIKGMDASEFPIIQGAEGGKTQIVLDAALLKETIAQVVIAAADDDSRPIFTGVLVEIKDKSITLCAADSFRMALRVTSLPADTYETQSPLIIPAKTLSELARILPSEGPVIMMITQNRSQVLFHTEQMDLVSRLIEGTFPNIHAAIPTQYTTRVVVDTKEFAAAVKRVAPFARDSANITTLHIEDKHLILKSNANDVGDNTVTINATVDGPIVQIIFNIRYLAEVIAVLNTPEIALEIHATNRPGVVRPVSTPAIDYTYVIMPMSSNS